MGHHNSLPLLELLVIEFLIIVFHSIQHISIKSSFKHYGLMCQKLFKKLWIFQKYCLFYIDIFSRIKQILKSHVSYRSS